MSWTRSFAGIMIDPTDRGSIMDVGDWLRSLGLGQYETLFRQNDIDAEVLSELTEGDLEKFGVSFGHRKRLLKAITSLAAEQPGAKPATLVPPGDERSAFVMASGPPSRSHEDERQVRIAERR